MLKGDKIMNKQSMWFLTLFSLVLVLSVYYITMPNELLLQNNSNVLGTETTINEVNDDDNVEVTITEDEEIVALRVSHEEDIINSINALESAMLDDNKTADEKNEVFEQIKYLNTLQSREEELEKLIKKTYNIDNFIEIDNSTIKVVAASPKHDVSLANNIMKTIQGQFKEKKYITVRFN